MCYLAFLTGILDFSESHGIPLDLETSIIFKDIYRINNLGFITTGSQPANIYQIPNRHEINIAMPNMTGYYFKDKIDRFISKLLDWSDITFIEIFDAITQQTYRYGQIENNGKSNVISLDSLELTKNKVARKEPLKYIEEPFSYEDSDIGYWYMQDLKEGEYSIVKSNKMLIDDVYNRMVHVYIDHNYPDNKIFSIMVRILHELYLE